MTIQTRLTAADELLLMPEDGYRFELTKGAPSRNVPAGDRHDDAAAWTAVEFGTYVRATDCGAVRAGIGYNLESGPETVRARDVSWIALDRVRKPIPEYRDGASGLAVEAKSPNDSRPEMFAKAQTWMGSGNRIVLALDPVPITVTVYGSNTEPLTDGENDVLDLGDLLPNFTRPVWRLFRQQV